MQKRVADRHGRGRQLYSLIPKGAAPPLRTPLKGSPLSHDYVVPALPEGEPSLTCQRGSVIKPNPVTPFAWGSFLKPTPWSRLPARALVASGDRSAPTEAGAETGRWTRATGTQRPPLITPHDTKFSPSEEAIYRGGPRGQRPLENPIKSKKENPPPAPAREQLSPWFGRGRGQGVGRLAPQARKIPPQRTFRDFKDELFNSCFGVDDRSPKAPVRERSERIGIFRPLRLLTRRAGALVGQRAQTVSCSFVGFVRFYNWGIGL